MDVDSGVGLTVGAEGWAHGGEKREKNWGNCKKITIKKEILKINKKKTTQQKNEKMM